VAFVWKHDSQSTVHMQLPLLLLLLLLLLLVVVVAQVHVS
jgi:hypothetical protein